jgi:hypothetical protein
MLVAMGWASAIVGFGESVADCHQVLGDIDCLEELFLKALGLLSLMIKAVALKAGDCHQGAAVRPHVWVDL